MITPVLNAIHNLNTRLRNLRKEEDGALTLIELLVYGCLLIIISIFSFQVLIPANEMLVNTVHDKNATKQTVALTNTLQKEASHIIATTPQDTRIGAVINTDDFDAILRAQTSQVIPDSYKYYLCKTAHSEVFLAAYDEQRPWEGYTKERPYVTNGYGLDIYGINGVSCGQYEKKDRYKMDKNGNYVFDVHGNPVIIKAGEFIWEPVKFGTL